VGADRADRFHVFARLAPAALGAALLIILVAATAAMGSNVIYRPATDASGNQANAISSALTLSADGRFAYFESDAGNLVPGDTNGSADVFVKDTSNGIITRLSVTQSGGQLNGHSKSPVITPDIRFLAFMSYANNAVPGDTNNASDIFLKSVFTGELTRISTDSSGAQANGPSETPAISVDGRYVAFRSMASNLVPGDTNGVMDVFVKDTQTGATTRVSTDSAGVEGDAESSAHYDPAISADGRYVAFESDASNLVPGDTDGFSDIFVKDTQTGVTTRVSTDGSGGQANGPSYVAQITADGRYVSFRSMADSLVELNGPMCGYWSCSDVFVKDTLTGAVTAVSTTSAGTFADQPSFDPTISPDGRFAAFVTNASNLEYGKTVTQYDVYVKDLQSGAVELVSKSAGGAFGNDWSIGPRFSFGGGFVGIYSQASNLVPGDTNGVYEVLLTDNTAACDGNRPSLSLSRDAVYWGSLGDYIDRILSVDYTIYAVSAYPVVNVAITDSPSSNGVTLASSMPMDLGNITGGSSAPATLQYNVPTGVTGYLTTVYVSAQDACGALFNWP
jgi:archaellum component FlaF (FlaF/FlaG flagellin family)